PSGRPAWTHGTSPWVTSEKWLSHSDNRTLYCHPRTCCEGPWLWQASFFPARTRSVSNHMADRKKRLRRHILEVHLAQPGSRTSHQIISDTENARPSPAGLFLLLRLRPSGQGKGVIIPIGAIRPFAPGRTLAFMKVSFHAGATLQLIAGFGK